MMLLRAARSADLAEIFKLSTNSGVGLTTLPKDKAVLARRLAWASASFDKTVQSPENEYYFFVLEDTATRALVGVSAIEASIGYKAPFYSYKVTTHHQAHPPLAIYHRYQALNLVNDYQGTSELCTLFLKPEYRKNNYGLLLSKARFLFIANEPKRFAKTIIAELRGVSDEQGCSPFWTHVNQPFFKMSFKDADALTLHSDKQFIHDLMPASKLYVPLLDAQAQAVIGMPHEATKPAMHLLLKEGFAYHNYVDIFDAGPTIEAQTARIRTIEQSRLYTLTAHPSELAGKASYLISNTGVRDFYATLSQAHIHEDTCQISAQTAAALQVKVGDKLRLNGI